MTLIEQMNADDKSKLFCFSENLIECRRQNEKKKKSDIDDMLCKSRFQQEWTRPGSKYFFVAD